MTLQGVVRRSACRRSYWASSGHRTTATSRSGLTLLNGRERCPSMARLRPGGDWLRPSLPWVTMRGLSRRRRDLWNLPPSTATCSTRCLRFVPARLSGAPDSVRELLAAHSQRRDDTRTRRPLTLRARSSQPFVTLPGRGGFRDVDSCAVPGAGDHRCCVLQCDAAGSQFSAGGHRRPGHHHRARGRGSESWWLSSPVLPCPGVYWCFVTVQVSRTSRDESQAR